MLWENNDVNKMRGIVAKLNVCFVFNFLCFGWRRIPINKEYCKPIELFKWIVETQDQREAMQNLKVYSPSEYSI